MTYYFSCPNGAHGYRILAVGEQDLDRYNRLRAILSDPEPIGVERAQVFALMHGDKPWNPMPFLERTASDMRAQS